MTERFDKAAALRLYGQQPEKLLRESMAEHGLVIDEPVLCDGEFHRFKSEGDRRKNGWYVCYADHGAFGNWRTGVRGNWSRTWHVPPHERREIQYQIRKAEREREQALAASHKRIGKVAREQWANAKNVRSHPYLKAKGVESYHLKVYGHALLVPMRVGDKLWNLQRIFPNGKKRFLKRGRVNGCYCAIGQPRGRIFIAEGYATAASIHAVTGDSVVVAFDCGNLPKVARAISQKQPGQELIIAADHDEAGIEAGHNAMVSGFAAHMVYPPTEGMDWNDYHQHCGRSAARKELLK